MKILSLKPYFQPEQFSSRHFGEATLQRQVERGHIVEIYTPIPTRGISAEVRRKYKNRKLETLENGAVTVHRFALMSERRSPFLRAVRYFLGELCFSWFGFWSKNIDVLQIGSTPPIHGLNGVFLRKLKGIPYVYYLADLFPDSLVSTGMTHKGSFMWKLGELISNIVYRNASRIIVISDQLKAKLVERGVPEEKIKVIYLWVDERSTQHVERSENRLFEEFSLSRNKFYVTYAGNFGTSQNVELLLDCADRLRNQSEIQFVLIGDGSQKPKILDKVSKLQLDNVSIFPMQPLERVSEVYSLGDVTFVSCQKGVGDGAFPSKVSVILGVGTPLIASYDRASDLCNLITDANAGLCVEPDDVDAAVDAILKFYFSPELRDICSQNGRKLANEKFSRERALSATVEVYEQVVEEDRKMKGARRR